VSELFVYIGLFDITTRSAGTVWLAGALAAALLALVGALAVACFAKVFGAVFLGQPRSAAAANVHEAPRVMTAPMATLALLCFAIGLGAPLIAPALDHATAAWAPELRPRLGASGDLAPLTSVAILYVPLAALLLLLGAWFARAIRRAPADVGTWDCGYTAPAARMQYTSSSFAQTLVSWFGWALRPHVERADVTGPFPGATHFASHVPDAVLDQVIVPAGRAAGRRLPWLLWVQRGSTHAYVFYILATLMLLLLWKGG
jgi:hydrogenase-4 component B